VSPTLAHAKPINDNIFCRQNYVDRANGEMGFRSQSYQMLGLQDFAERVLFMKDLMAYAERGGATTVLLSCFPP
jgi:hypothetical protein